MTRDVPSICQSSNDGLFHFRVVPDLTLVVSGIGAGQGTSGPVLAVKLRYHHHTSLEGYMISFNGLNSSLIALTVVKR